MTPAFVALGANLGDPVATIRHAMAELATIDGCRITRRSGLYRTAPVGLKNQPDFINAAVAMTTRLTAEQLLNELFAVEARFGRQRGVKNAPRTLDLDLLLYGELIQTTAHLTLPHPRLHERAFVLAPLGEIAPGLRVPGHGPVEELLAGCHDQRIALLHPAS